MTLTKAQKIKRDEAINSLRGMYPVGTTLYTILRQVSRSGMSRHISVIDGNSQDITWLAGLALNYRRADDGGLVVGGTGMDMGFAVIYELAQVMFPEGFECVGDGGDNRSARCPSNDHSNGDRNYAPHHHNSGGYALRHRWL